MEISIPFASTLAYITGEYYPSTPDVMYLPNGDPGCPGTDAEFIIDSFSVGDEDILNELTSLYIRKPNGEYQEYLDSIYDKILEEAKGCYMEELDWTEWEDGFDPPPFDCD